MKILLILAMFLTGCATQRYVPTIESLMKESYRQGCVDHAMMSLFEPKPGATEDERREYDFHMMVCEIRSSNYDPAQAWNYSDDLEITVQKEPRESRGGLK